MFGNNADLVLPEEESNPLYSDDLDNMPASDIASDLLSDAQEALWALGIEDIPELSR